MGILIKPDFVRYIKAVDFKIISECGVDAALVLPLLQDRAYTSCYDKTAIRSSGEIRLRASYEDLCPLAEVFGLERYHSALEALQQANIIIVEDDDMIVMADVYGPVPSKDQPKKKVEHKRHLYLFKGGDGLHKIGITKNLTRRAKELYPAVFVVSAEIIDALAHEQRLHREYAEYRQGGEWFKIPEDMIDCLVAEIKGLAS